MSIPEHIDDGGPLLEAPGIGELGERKNLAVHTSITGVAVVKFGLLGVEVESAFPDAFKELLISQSSRLRINKGAVGLNAIQASHARK